jgi:hypothetical protein
MGDPSRGSHQGRNDTGGLLHQLISEKLLDDLSLKNQDRVLSPRKLRL